MCVMFGRYNEFAHSSPLESSSYYLDCPSGNHAVNPLFLQMPAFDGEQWAPASNYDNEEIDLGNDWILVGTINSNQTSTCLQYDVLNDGNYPLWAVDGTKTELKENILCCSKQEALSVEYEMTKEYNSIWLDESHGWSGGSYDDAEAFCEGLGEKHICPYEACECELDVVDRCCIVMMYAPCTHCTFVFSIDCPHGPGMNPQGGHSADFNSEGMWWGSIRFVCR